MAGLNETASGNRVHIAFFGRRNAGKSSVVNAVTGQPLSIVSDVKGTTTDPVQKSMELLPLGPVVIIDTPGIDDEGAVGALRVQRARQVLNKTDVAVLVVDGTAGKTEEDEALCALFRKKGVPFLTVYNKADLQAIAPVGKNEITVSALTGENIGALKERIAALAQTGTGQKTILGDLLEPGDHVVLVTPIDESAPKGRMILPQVQAIREILDADAKCLVVRENRVAEAIANEKVPPAFVVTDSQAVRKVVEATPAAIPVTTFSIQMAYSKSDLVEMARGAAMLDFLKPGDKVMICETCSHHPQPDDIGRKKLPRWLAQKIGGPLDIEVVVGKDFPADLSPYQLILQCGGCVVTRQHMLSRVRAALAQGVPMTNYGVAISHLQGVLTRALELHPEAKKAFDEAHAALEARFGKPTLNATAQDDNAQ